MYKELFKNNNLKILFIKFLNEVYGDIKLNEKKFIEIQTKPSSPYSATASATCW